MIEESNEGVTIAVKVIPRGKRNEIVSVEADTLKVRLSAPPVEGRANEALIKFLAGLLNIPRANVEIVRGHTSRQKWLRVRGVSSHDVRDKLKLSSEM